MILRDLYCETCSHIRRDVFVEGQNYPSCRRCKTPYRNLISKINSDSWGSPRYHPALDLYFDSKSDYKRHLKEKGLMECGDPVGGARNQDYLRLGKRFSYAGQKNRSGRDYAETRTERTLAPTVTKQGD